MPVKKPPTKVCTTKTCKDGVYWLKIITKKDGAYTIKGPRILVKEEEGMLLVKDTVKAARNNVRLKSEVEAILKDYKAKKAKLDKQTVNKLNTKWLADLISAIKAIEPILKKMPDDKKVGSLKPKAYMEALKKLKVSVTGGTKLKNATKKLMKVKKPKFKF